MSSKSIDAVWFNSKLISAWKLIVKIFRWNWMSVLALGISCNWAINAIFDYKYQRPLVSFSIEEYFNAIVAAAVLLTGTRWITSILDKKLPWTSGVTKRIFVQLGLHLAYILISLNLLLVSITYFVYGGFYTMGDMAVINIGVVSLTFFVSIIDIGIFFYRNWKTHALADKREGAKVQNQIRLTLGRSQHLIKESEILYAVSKQGLVIVLTRDHRKLPYGDSLEHLMKSLSPAHFFRANRQTIVRQEVVSSIRSLDYGKIEVSLSMNGDSETITISRKRAAAFRKWLKTG